jgi:hypothetical protein
LASVFADGQPNYEYLQEIKGCAKSGYWQKLLRLTIYEEMICKLYDFNNIDLLGRTAETNKLNKTSNTDTDSPELCETRKPAELCPVHMK